MTRAFKAAIFNQDRTLSVYYINNKLKIGSNAFRLKKNQNEVYIIDPAYTITTITKRMFMPFRYTTCYYKRNTPVAMPVPEMGSVEADGFIEVIKDKKGKTKEEIGVKIIMPLKAPEFEEWKYPASGISSQELGTLFNPAFYQMIAKSNRNKKEDQMYYMQIGILIIVAFIGYYMTQKLPHAIIKLLQTVLGGGS